MHALRVVIGLVVGYATMAILITLVQETWLGGVGFYESSLSELAVGGLFTTLSAVVGAAVGSAIAADGKRIIAIIMSLLVVAETTALTMQGRLGGPLWFDLLAAGGLIVGIWIGAELVIRLRRRPWSAGA